MIKLILGCGYLGRRVAQRWLNAGHTVFAVTRYGSRAKELKQQGMVPLVADITKPATLDQLPEVETVLFAVGFDPRSVRTRHECYVDGLQAVLNALSPQIQRFILISSTAVYGQNDGEWVDENSACLPKTESGLALFEAEKLLLVSRFAAKAIILRIAGIYGPGRLLRRTKDLLAAAPIVVPKNNFLNLIHVEDAAMVIVTADERAKPPCKYIVSDGNPVQHEDYLNCLAELISAPKPEYIEPISNEFETSRNLSNKRLINTKMLAELGVQLRYSTFRRGLDDLHQTGHLHLH